MAGDFHRVSSEFGFGLTEKFSVEGSDTRRDIVQQIMRSSSSTVASEFDVSSWEGIFMLDEDYYAKSLSTEPTCPVTSRFPLSTLLEESTSEEESNINDEMIGLYNSRSQPINIPHRSNRDCRSPGSYATGLTHRAE
eukprot:CAMPEP_0196660238 /NCGR_PEP_ID=MMETSP1086-20130531/38795_1 /TAXON_ID=77921 /ORGANISM="Cyanoptyche  gloeocystis , Strain SAG4.97" /LENGTH=136 /DNA_ID=CAMNT_0041994555 /DNA_START=136 /DNA_END=546 /DNA_ORIENTATION=+